MTSTLVLDWISLLTRWVHFTAGIAWIGSSFYFIWVDRNLAPPSAAKPGVEGELWMVHSGGFYQLEKRRVGPGDMPPVLHWFKWEAALTWASGVVLLVVVYYLTGGAYLVDPAVSALSANEATLLSVGLLVVGWFVYDAIWRSSLARTGWPAVALSLALLGGVVFGLFHALSARAAYIHVGALLGSLMVANVWAVILPAQQKMIDATRSGEQPDYSVGEGAKRRSVHNSYMTLPVLFTMLSSHFPQTYGIPLGWLVLLLLMAGGALARHVMISRSPRRRWALAPMTACLLASVVLATPRTARLTADAGATSAAVPFGAARVVINARCLACHSAYPVDKMFTAAPNGVMFDTPEQIVRLAARIRERAVVQRTMPFANKTGITDAERETLRRWIDTGARLP